MAHRMIVFPNFLNGFRHSKKGLKHVNGGLQHVRTGKIFYLPEENSRLLRLRRRKVGDEIQSFPLGGGLLFRG